MYEFKARRRIEFSETDMAGIVHFSNFFRYMETAEHAFYRALGHSVILSQFSPPIGFPRVHAECDFRKPLRFEDEIEIHLLVREKKVRTLSYLFRFLKVEGPQLVEAARGLLTVVCVIHHPGGRLEAVPIPPAIADQIEPAPPELLLTP